MYRINDSTRWKTFFRAKADSPVLIWDAFSPVLPCVVTACQCSNILLSTPGQLWPSVFPKNITYVSSRVSKDLKHLFTCAQILHSEVRYHNMSSNVSLHMIWASNNTHLIFLYSSWMSIVTHLCLFYVFTGIFKAQSCKSSHNHFYTA